MASQIHTQLFPILRTTLTADGRQLTRREASQEKPDNPRISLNISLLFDIRWDFTAVNQRYLEALFKTSDSPDWDNAAPIFAQ